MFYVYALIDPRTRNPFYIGKGKGNRFDHHKWETENTKRVNKRKHKIISELKNDNLEYGVKILKEEILSEEDAFRIEELWILRLGRIGFEENGILTNLIIGSRPPSLSGKDNPMWGKTHTKETRNKISKKIKGRKLSQKHKEKISKSIKTYLIDNDHNWTGKKHSDETKQKMKLAQSGENNPSFGTKWITDGIIAKKVLIDDVDEWISNGWKLGRK